MAKYVGYKRPKDTKKTIKHLLVYLGLHKWSFVLVAVLVGNHTFSLSCNAV